ncbi:MAG: RNA polymerase sigma factor [Actinomycetota bacterium]
MTADSLGRGMPPIPRTMSEGDENTAHQGVPSLEEIFRALAPAVLGYLRAGGAQDPEDVAGDVFLAVALGLRRFHGDDAAVRSWVFTIAHHKLIDERRRAARRRLTRRVSRSEVSYDDPPFDPGMAAALRTLTPEQREIVTLRFVADLPIAVVAEITERSVEAVKAMQHRALESVARAFSVEEL